MKPIVWLVAIITLSHLTSCATRVTSTGDPHERIEYWLNQQEYGKALAVVADLKASPTSVTRNLREVEEKINARVASYERQVIIDAEGAIARNDWAAALRLYHVALSRLPDSQVLQRGERQILQRHAEHLDRLVLERLIAEGEWMLKDLEVRRLAEANNEAVWWGRFLLDRKIASARELASELIEHGRHALERWDMALARRILLLATSLSNTPENRALLAAVPEALNEEGARFRKGQEPTADVQSARPHPLEPENDRERATFPGQEQKKAKRLMDDFREACRQKKLAEAKELMSQLEKQGVNSQEFQNLSKQLDRDVAKQVKHLSELGGTRYSQQRYEEALVVWKQAQVLDPRNDQLNARIQRVTRVLEKLQNLRSKSPVTP